MHVTRRSIILGIGRRRKKNEQKTILINFFCLQVSWYRRQKKLHETDRLLFQTKGSRQTLYIRQVKPQDFGNYSCRAENNLGEARTFTELSGKLKMRE